MDRKDADRSLPLQVAFQSRHSCLQMKRYERTTSCGRWRANGASPGVGAAPRSVSRGMRVVMGLEFAHSSLSSDRLDADLVPPLCD